MEDINIKKYLIEFDDYLDYTDRVIICIKLKKVRISS